MAYIKNISHEEVLHLADQVSADKAILSCVLNKPITNTDGIKELIPELKRAG